MNDRDSLRRLAAEANRISWNHATPAHDRHKGDQGAWLASGGDPLFPEELTLLGDLNGRRLLHLQCNAGQDSLALARRGAHVHGVDVSDEAISRAEALSESAGIPAFFERADVYDFLERTHARFDVAFASYGVLGWLADLDRWAAGVRRALRPGGRLVLVEFHPAPLVFDPSWQPAWPYSSNGEPLPDEGVPDYVQASGGALSPSGTLDETPFENPHRTLSFSWGLGDVLGAVLRAGLHLERFEEWPYSNGWRPFEDAVPLPGRRWQPPPGRPALPLMFGLTARS